MAERNSVNKLPERYEAGPELRNLPCASHWVCQRYDASYNTGQPVCCDGVCVNECGFDWVILTIIVICCIAGLLCCIALCMLLYYSVKGVLERRTRRRDLRMRMQNNNGHFRGTDSSINHIRVPSPCIVPPYSPPLPPPAGIVPPYQPTASVASGTTAATNRTHHPHSPPPEYPTSAVPPPDYQRSTTGELHRSTDRANSPENTNKSPTPTRETNRVV